MLLEARETGCIKEIIVLASALSVQDPWQRPVENSREADEKHGLFKVPSSDFLTLLNLWEHYHQLLNEKKATNQIKRYCKTHYLSYRRMREWQDVIHQISAILKEQGIRQRFTVRPKKTEPSSENTKNKFDQRYTDIHRSVLSGHLSNIALKKEKNVYQAAKGRDVMIFPGSVLFNDAGEWIVASEIVETSRVFARIVAEIDPMWLEELGRAHCKYTYHHPHWSRNQGQVVALEQVSLFGLIIHSGRQVSYGKINAKEASEIFIRNALVEGDIRNPFAFMKHNQKVIDDIRDMENKIRRRDLMVGEEELLLFYQDKLEGVCDIRSLRHHLKKKGGDHHLRMKQEDLLRYSPDGNELALFPDKITLGSHALDVSYQFDPGKQDDGLTVKVPEPLTAAIPSDAIDWMVPGFYREKILLLIRGLPKGYRKQLVPLTQTVDIILKEMPKTQGVLISALGKFIHDRFHVDIPASMWPEDQLPEHLKARISIRDAKDREIRSGRDTAILAGTRKESNLPPEVLSYMRQWEKTGITRWDFGDIPEQIPIPLQGDSKWLAYPGLKENERQADQVDLRLFQNKAKSIVWHKKGVMRLFVNYLSKDLKFLKKHLSLPDDIAGDSTWLGTVKQIEARMYHHVLSDLFSRNIRSEKQFYDHAEQVAAILLTKGKIYLDKVLPVLDTCNKTSRFLHDLRSAHRFNNTLLPLIGELERQIRQLLPESFMDLYEVTRFPHLNRYMQAIVIRAQRAVVNLEKDREKSIEILKFSEPLKRILGAISPETILSEEKKMALEEFFWMIEEYKVSIFAQELKTEIPISGKRLEAKLGEIERMV